MRLLGNRPRANACAETMVASDDEDSRRTRVGKYLSVMMPSLDEDNDGGEVPMVSSSSSASSSSFGASIFSSSWNCLRSQAPNWYIWDSPTEDKTSLGGFSSPSKMVVVEPCRATTCTWRRTIAAETNGSVGGARQATSKEGIDNIASLAGDRLIDKEDDNILLWFR